MWPIVFGTLSTRPNDFRESCHRKESIAVQMDYTNPITQQRGPFLFPILPYALSQPPANRICCCGCYCCTIAAAATTSAAVAAAAKETSNKTTSPPLFSARHLQLQLSFCTPPHLTFLRKCICEGRSQNGCTCTYTQQRKEHVHVGKVVILQCSNIVMISLCLVASTFLALSRSM